MLATLLEAGPGDAEALTLHGFKTVRPPFSSVLTPLSLVWSLQYTSKFCDKMKIVSVNLTAQGLILEIH